MVERLIQEEQALVNQFVDLTPDRQTIVYDAITKARTFESRVFEPYDERQLYLINQVRGDLVDNPKRHKNKLIYEHVLDLFENRGKTGVKFSELVDLIEKESKVAKKDTGVAAWKLINRLRPKFRFHGGEIVMVHKKPGESSIYAIIRDENNQS